MSATRAGSSGRRPASTRSSVRRAIGVEHRRVQRTSQVVGCQHVGAENGATPAQTALAWLLSRGEDIAPIPGTRRVSRVEENIAADAIELTPDQIHRLDNLEPAGESGTTWPTWPRSTADQLIAVVVGLDVPPQCAALRS